MGIKSKVVMGLAALVVLAAGGLVVAQGAGGINVAQLTEKRYKVAPNAEWSMAESELQCVLAMDARASGDQQVRWAQAGARKMLDGKGMEMGVFEVGALRNVIEGLCNKK